MSLKIKNYYNKLDKIENSIFDLMKKLWPINRSITGQGQVETLKELKMINNDLKIKNFKTGQKVFDWEIPKVWNVNDAWIKDKKNKKIIDFKNNNLHLVGYSSPINKKIKGSDLIGNLHYIKTFKNAIPYVTSYYKKNWGFCLTYKQFKKINVNEYYQVKIDSKFSRGKMYYGEIFLKGKSKKEILLSTYLCHPSMANNELSGPCLTIYLSKILSKQKKNNYSYRILFIPETIGSIAYLSKNYLKLKKNVVAGYNISCIGDNRNYSYLLSKNEKSISNQVALNVLHHISKKGKVYDWSFRASDERQYNSQGIDLPIGVLMRTRYGDYPEYHTSLDQLGTVVNREGIKGGMNYLTDVIQSIEIFNIKPKPLIKCEPQLSKRNLYPSISKREHVSTSTKKMLEVLSQCDGKKNLIEISDICSIFICETYQLLEILKQNKFVRY
jgi:aminopeptidase-like protein